MTNMPAKVPFPIKFKPLYRGVTFALKDTAGKLIDDKTLPFCTSFSHSIAHSAFAVCASLLRRAGVQQGILEVRSPQKKVLQVIDIDEHEYRLWLQQKK